MVVGSARPVTTQELKTRILVARPSRPGGELLPLHDSYDSKIPFISILTLNLGIVESWKKKFSPNRERER